MSIVRVFQEDTFFTLGVESNSIWSLAIKGSNLRRCQDDVLPGVKCDDPVV